MYQHKILTQTEIFLPNELHVDSQHHSSGSTSVYLITKYNINSVFLYITSPRIHNIVRVSHSSMVYQKWTHKVLYMASAW